MKRELYEKRIVWKEDCMEIGLYRKKSLEKRGKRRVEIIQKELTVHFV